MRERITVEIDDLGLLAPTLDEATRVRLRNAVEGSIGMSPLRMAVVNAAVQWRRTGDPAPLRAAVDALLPTVQVWG